MMLAWQQTQCFVAFQEYQSASVREADTVQVSSCPYVRIRPWHPYVELRLTIALLTVLNTFCCNVTAGEVRDDTSRSFHIRSESPRPIRTRRQGCPNSPQTARGAIPAPHPVPPRRLSRIPARAAHPAAVGAAQPSTLSTPAGAQSASAAAAVARPGTAKSRSPWRSTDLRHPNLFARKLAPPHTSPFRATENTGWPVIRAISRACASSLSTNSRSDGSA